MHIVAASSVNIFLFPFILTPFFNQRSFKEVENGGLKYNALKDILRAF